MYVSALKTTSQNKGVHKIATTIAQLKNSIDDLLVENEPLA